MYDHITKHTRYSKARFNGSPKGYFELNTIINNSNTILTEVYGNAATNSGFTTENIDISVEDRRSITLFEESIRSFTRKNFNADPNGSGLYELKKVFEVIYTNRELLVKFPDNYYTEEMRKVKKIIFAVIEDIHDNILNVSEFFTNAVGEDICNTDDQ